jgi:hypothetical protein
MLKSPPVEAFRSSMILGSLSVLSFVVREGVPRFVHNAMAIGHRSAGNLTERPTIFAHITARTTASPSQRQQEPTYSVILTLYVERQCIVVDRQPLLKGGKLVERFAVE